MKILIIADCYPPMKTSAAVMLEDLALEILKSGHLPIVIVPDPELVEPFIIESLNGVDIYRVACLKTKDVGYIRRTISEFLMPFIIRKRLAKSGLFDIKVEGLIWYSPTIFFGPLIKILKKTYKCKTYLVLRDIFPEWAVDLGIMKKGVAYKLFKLVESYQYSLADRIGVQTPANITYFNKNYSYLKNEIEVLHNWLTPAKIDYCSIKIEETFLAGRKIFVYAGNMGKAQDMLPFVKVMEKIDKSRDDIGVLFVGRGSEVEIFRKTSIEKNLTNVIIHDEINNSEISGLYDQCHFGLVFLDSRHTTHNIPGKFISYMHFGLPTLAFVNKGNDLFDVINSESLGKAFYGIDTKSVSSDIVEMADNQLYIDEVPEKCREFSKKYFSSFSAANQILRFLKEYN